MSDNPILTKSFAFALRIVKVCRHLAEVHKEFTLSRELLIAGTNIGKHVKEAVSGESPEAFTMFMAKALRRADETEYWIQLIHFAGLIDDRGFGSIETDRKELAKMLTRIVQTSKKERL